MSVDFAKFDKLVNQDVCYPAGNDDRCYALTTTKSIVPNVCHVLWDIQRCKFGAKPKSVVPN